MRDVCIAVRDVCIAARDVVGVMSRGSVRASMGRGSVVFTVLTGAALCLHALQVQRYACMPYRCSAVPACPTGAALRLHALQVQRYACMPYSCAGCIGIEWGQDWAISARAVAGPWPCVSYSRSAGL